jgi:hypothetical protein
MSAELRPISGFYEAHPAPPIEEPRHAFDLAGALGAGLAFVALGAVALLAGVVILGAWQGVATGGVPASTALVASGSPLLAMGLYRLLARRW